MGFIGGFSGALKSQLWLLAPSDWWLYGWLVLWNMNFMIFHTVGNNPNWLSDSSEGLKPPTRWYLVGFIGGFSGALKSQLWLLAPSDWWLYGWLVLWNMNFMTFHTVGNNPNWLSYFSEGLKPPTRWYLVGFIDGFSGNFKWSHSWPLKDRKRSFCQIKIDFMIVWPSKSSRYKSVLCKFFIGKVMITQSI